jgi:hypothetical protein
MTLLVVHPADAAVTPGLGPTRSSFPAPGEPVVVLSVLSTRSFGRRRAMYASLPDLDLVYSYSQAEASAERHAQRYVDEVLRPLGFDGTALGRVGNELRTAAAVARAYEADRIAFSTPASRVRRWFRAWRLARLDFGGTVSSPPRRDVPGVAPDSR